MTETVERIVHEQRFWIAEDGSKFWGENDCIKYEKLLAQKRAVKKIKHFSFTPSSMDDHIDWDWYLVKSQDEFDAVVNELYAQDSGVRGCTACDFQRWMAFSVDENGYGKVEGTLGEVFKAFEKFKQGVLEEIRKAGADEESRG